jgi:tetratricopeptide (TPR) repeat protein
MDELQLKVEEVLPHEWRFVYDEREVSLVEKLFDAVSLIQGGDTAAGEQVLASILASSPNHLDARVLLARLDLFRKETTKALNNLQATVKLGLEALPERFIIGQDRLEWVWPENRPFLRALASLGMAYYEGGKRKEAAETFRQILALDPRDHQGIRSSILELAFIMGDWEKVWELCTLFPDDQLVDMLFARPLALLRLGDVEAATRSLMTARDAYPLVARELRKKRHPRPACLDPEFVTLGGRDEAYLYWKRMGKFWRETPGAMELIESCTNESGAALKKRPSPRR